MDNDLIQREINNAEITEYCSLYRAIRWIAFDEKPINNAKLHSKRNNIGIVSQNNGGIRHRTLEVNWESADDRERFDKTCELLLQKLSAEEILSEGLGLKQQLNPTVSSVDIISENYQQHESEYTVIPTPFWKEILVGKEWYLSQAENCALSPRNIEFTAYKDIRFKSLDVEQCFFQKTKDKEALSTKERKTAGKLIIGLAILNYGKDDVMKDSGPVPSELAGDLMDLGIEINTDTIRKYLKIGKDAI